MHTSEEVKEVMVANNHAGGVVSNGKRYLADNVSLAPGRVGADWVGGLVQDHGIGVEQRGMEVGFRVEVHNDIMPVNTIRPNY